MKRTDEARTILITGAGGFIGGWVAEMLHLQGNWHVRAGVRRWPSAARIARFPMEIVLCDVNDPASVAMAADGCTDIVHCATADGHTIVDGTRNVLEAALQIHARVIHLSSIAVYGDAPGHVPEDTPFARHGSEYSQAKVASEYLCHAYHQRGVKTVILRPTIVYGPYSTWWTTNVALRLLTGQWGNIGSAGGGTCNLVYVLDVVQAIRRALRCEAANGQAFNVNGPSAVTWSEYFAEFNKALGLPELKNVNPTLARWRSRLLFPARCFGKFMLEKHRGLLISVANRSRRIKSALKSAESTLRATATSDQLALYGLKAHYPSGKAEQMLGYRPHFDVEAGLDMSCAWLKHSGIIER
ncbi:MAG TPA: NAD(P)-dependent oxidoreductase [Planctomycetota bacterium]|jgi:nucleoside-diphosphate-sugar epimerase